MFVTFEGLDLCGKSTQSRRLAETLSRRHAADAAAWPPVRLLREPGGTEISERLREILLDTTHGEMDGRTETLLFSASRAQLVSQVIRPALRRGEIVVCDRYFDSTTAYQGYGRGLDLDDVRRVNAIATGRLDPDLTLFVDITVEEIARRREAAGSASDRMESSGRDFYERVRGGFLAIVNDEAHRCVRVNGMAPVDDVAAEVWDVFLRWREKNHKRG
jgi:dTMP kinase